MQTPSEKRYWGISKHIRIKFDRTKNTNRRNENVRHGGIQSQLIADAEKLIIKPGMKLVYDEQLNMMVWK